MKPIELGDKCVRIVLDMFIVLAKDLPQKLMFGVVDGLDDVLVVSREVEEASTLSWRTKFGKNVLARE